MPVCHAQLLVCEVIRAREEGVMLTAQNLLVSSVSPEAVKGQGLALRVQSSGDAVEKETCVTACHAVAVDERST